ncbi:thioredoxin fold domain-containing protein [candidate division KSB1 bacterium]|nr:thioredoxin fold domain-containing protein [candidate division KSB1 bacterium]
MLKYVLLSLVLLFSCAVEKSAEQGVEFVDLTFEKTLQKAIETGKPVLLNIHAEWCSPCKRLYKQVFLDGSSGAYINEATVPLRVDGEKGEGPELMKTFNVRGYPTTLLLTSKGEEIDRIVGYSGDKAKFLQKVKEYVEGKNTVADLKSRVQDNPDNAELYIKLARKYNERGNDEKAAVHFERVVELGPANRDLVEEAEFQLALHNMRETGDTQPIETIIQQSDDQQLREQAWYYLIRYYDRNDKPDKLFQAYEKALDQMPENTTMMNSYAWYVFQNEVEKKYNRGIEVAQKAVELDPKAHQIWDTLGQLQFAAGNTEGAIKAMSRAAELNPEEESYKENLKAYKEKKM